MRVDKNIVKTAVEKYSDDFFTCDSKRLLNLSFGRVYWFITFISSHISRTGRDSEGLHSNPSLAYNQLEGFTQARQPLCPSFTSKE